VREGCPGSVPTDPGCRLLVPGLRMLGAASGPRSPRYRRGPTETSCQDLVIHNGHNRTLGSARCSDSEAWPPPGFHATEAVRQKAVRRGQAAAGCPQRWSIHGCLWMCWCSARPSVLGWFGRPPAPGFHATEGVRQKAVRWWQAAVGCPQRWSSHSCLWMCWCSARPSVLGSCGRPPAPGFHASNRV